MARPLRSEYVGALYHVTSRGNERKDVFTSQRGWEKTKGLESLLEQPNNWRNTMQTKPLHRNTLPVSDKVFKAVYDSPQSLPGKHKWLTVEADVRKIEDLLGMPAKPLEPLFG